MIWYSVCCFFIRLKSVAFLLIQSWAHHIYTYGKYLHYKHRLSFHISFYFYWRYTNIFYTQSQLLMEFKTQFTMKYVRIPTGINVECKFEWERERERELFRYFNGWWGCSCYRCWLCWFSCVSSLSFFAIQFLAGKTSSLSLLCIRGMPSSYLMHWLILNFQHSILTYIHLQMSIWKSNAR